MLFGCIEGHSVNGKVFLNYLLKKLKVYGDELLTNEELLSIVIGRKNTKDKNLEIAKNLIKENKDLTGDLQFLMQISIEELIRQGLNFEDAVRLKAVAGIFKRLSYITNFQKLEVNSSTDVANLFMPELRFEQKEIVKLVILNNKNTILKISTLSIGTSNSATISPKDILSEPIKMKADRIILVHNHPSGDSNPSFKDIKTTEVIEKCASIMGIELLDHIVIGNGTWNSAMP